MTFEVTIERIQQEQPPLHQICLYFNFLHSVTGTVAFWLTMLSALILRMHWSGASQHPNLGDALKLYLFTESPIKGQSIQRKNTHHSQDGKQGARASLRGMAHNKGNPPAIWGEGERKAKRQETACHPWRVTEKERGEEAFTGETASCRIVPFLMSQRVWKKTQT